MSNLTELEVLASSHAAAALVRARHRPMAAMFTGSEYAMHDGPFDCAGCLPGVPHPCSKVRALDELELAPIELREELQARQNQAAAAALQGLTAAGVQTRDLFDSCESGSPDHLAYIAQELESYVGARSVEPAASLEPSEEVERLTGIIGEAVHFLSSGHGITVIEGQKQLRRMLEGNEAGLYRNALKRDRASQATLARVKALAEEWQEDGDGSGEELLQVLAGAQVAAR